MSIKVTVVDYEQSTDSFFYTLSTEPNVKHEIAADKAFQIWEERDDMTAETDLHRRAIAEFMNLDYEEPVDLVNQSTTV